MKQIRYQTIDTGLHSGKRESHQDLMNNILWDRKHGKYIKLHFYRRDCDIKTLSYCVESLRWRMIKIIRAGRRVDPEAPWSLHPHTRGGIHLMDTAQELRFMLHNIDNIRLSKANVCLRLTVGPAILVADQSLITA